MSPCGPWASGFLLGLSFQTHSSGQTVYPLYVPLLHVRAFLFLYVFQLECVGSVDSGITAMQWSPDLELLIITTGKDAV